ncbi:MAG TPA: TIGR03620 family F420-dependent LLM class oxidoreductase [Miltoncostaeaceae bacterium]|nr:TIGR03620 family F420-dependent LLM class oxidoreductase [Miltoncostaeaceae bacterium]
MADPGHVGVWSGWFRSADPDEAGMVAAELEALGYDAIWFPAGEDGGWFPRVRAMLDATARVVVATGIVNIWTNDADATAAHAAALRDRHPDRFILGLGVGHAPVDRAYAKPVTAMTRFLDRLDAASPPVPAEGRVIAALWPRMLEIARERSAGSHTYLVTPEHTRRARAALGPDRLLVPELAAVVESDPEHARELGRAFLAPYLALPNYTGGLRRLGFGDEDLAGGGSDRLLDALVARGEPDEIRARMWEHRAAGADQVAIQVIGAQAGAPPRAGWRALASALKRD